MPAKPIKIAGPGMDKINALLNEAADLERPFKGEYHAEDRWAASAVRETAIRRLHSQFGEFLRHATPGDLLLMSHVLHEHERENGGPSGGTLFLPGTFARVLGDRR